MGQELLSVDGWLDSVIQADTAMQALIKGFWVDDLPDVDPLTDGGQYWPALVATFSAGSDSSAVGGIRYLTGVTMAVKAIGQEGYGPLGPIMDRFEALFCADGTSSGAVFEGRTVGRLIRQTPIKYSEGERKVRYYHLGGEYRLYVN